MKRIALLVLTVLLTGCSGSRQAMTGQRDDVFKVFKVDDQVGSGAVRVTISASIKTHKEPYASFDMSRHGSVDYPLIIDINGQSLTLLPLRTEESTSTDLRADPESGTGMRYTYVATVQLKPDAYTLTAILPGENVRISRQVQITDHVRNIVIKPVYREGAGRKPATLRWLPDFRDGVRDMEIMVL